MVQILLHHHPQKAHRDLEGTTLVRPGDDIYALAGCSQPVCLRPDEAVEDALVVVSPAFVHGEGVLSKIEVAATQRANNKFAGTMHGEAVIEEAECRYPGEDAKKHIDDVFHKITLV